jgi:hypothetical protein
MNSYSSGDRNITIVTILIIGFIYFTLDAIFQLMKKITYRDLKGDMA